MLFVFKSISFFGCNVILTPSPQSNRLLGNANAELSPVMFTWLYHDLRLFLEHESDDARVFTLNYLFQFITQVNLYPS
jgi:hypothetical protein